MSLETVVILGAGQAGAWAARTLRSEGFSGRVILIGAEAALPYERPPLSKEQLQRTPPAMQYLLSTADLGSLDIEWRRSSQCIRIDRSNRNVVLTSGEAIAYDRLILCTGGRARLPVIPGIAASCVHTLRTIEDAERLRLTLKEKARVLVMGGGWIGLEAAAAACAAGCSVTLVEAGPLLCTRTGSPMLSDFLAKLHRSNGVELRLGESVVALEHPTATSSRAVYADGTIQDVDVVVVGIGLEQNDVLARAAGLECDRGILVDQQCRTSDWSIFAAGDVTAMRGPSGEVLRLESWQNAQDQGIAAARALLGHDIDYQPVPVFWSQQYEVLVQIAGACVQGTKTVTRGAERGKLIAVQLTDDGPIASAICANSPRDFRHLRNFIAEGVCVDVERLVDASVPITAAIASRTS